MFRFIYILILFTLMLLIIFLLNRLRKKTGSELDRILYIQNKPELYLQLLKNPRLKLLYTKSTLEQFEFNAYLLLGRDQEIKRIINSLDSIPMTKGQSLEYNLKKLSYYCSEGDSVKAEDTLKKIEAVLSKVKGSKAQSILNESKLIFHIYIMHDTKLIKDLEEIQREQKGAARGITLYRLAKLNYFDGNDKGAKSYLEEAKELLKGTPWFEVAEAALKDMSILNYK